MLGPAIVGEKVRLGPPPEDFAETIVKWEVEADIVRYVNAFPATVAQEREWMEERARDPNWVYWAIWVEGKPVGLAAISEIDWRNRHGETITWIGPAEIRGHGCGTEVVELRAQYAFSELDFEKLVAMPRADNTPSVKALKHAGFREVGVLQKQVFSEGKWRDVWVGELIRDGAQQGD